MDFLNHREGRMLFYKVFLLSPLQCTVTELQKLLREFEEKKSQGKALDVIVIVNSKGENSSMNSVSVRARQRDTGSEQ